MANQLIHEKSPYLLQHAHNPVDWLPWGPAAFAKAQEEDKPIFLSIGYSTCHWCHVMERESFEQVAIAQILNRDFIPVKVDREERPDVDRIYMAYVQAATGSGGWPMSVWLTPGLHPFVGGTYFPPDDRYGRPGLSSVLQRIARAWREERPRILESSGKVVEQLRAITSSPEAPEEPAPGVLARAFDHFAATFDAELGGFGSAPKFPRPVIFHFLLRYWAETKQSQALDMVTATLAAMARGGMNDQLGGGFHRYSVDAYWFVPHFEKMLYDQAQLAASYLEAFQITGEPSFREETCRILDYVLRDLTHPEGGFYSAEDADSAPDPANLNHKTEGAFYLWEAGAIKDRFFAYRFGVEHGGNVQNDPHSEFTGRNILFAAHTEEETAHHFAVPIEEVRAAIAATARRLFAERGTRPRPMRDDKVLTSWNGMMIGAFARAGAVLRRADYTEAALRAAAFLRRHLYRDSMLFRRFREGSAAVPAFLDDYASFIAALLELYECTLQPEHLDFAIQLAARQSELFEDPQGGFFSTAESAADLVLRMKDDYDGAEPGANAIAALNLLKLARFTRREDYTQSANRLFRAFAHRMNQSPYAMPQLLAAYQYSLTPPDEVTFTGSPVSPEAQPLLDEFYRRFLPHFTIAFKEAAGGATEAPVSVTVCRNFVCQLPVSTSDRFAELLQ